MTKQNVSPTSAASPNRSRILLWTAGIATFLAILDHIYLLREHYALKFGAQAGQSLCNINEMFNCASVAASRFSEIWGMPMALLGAAVNSALLLLLLWYPFSDDEKKTATQRNLILLSGVIAVTSIIMGAISSFVLRRYCPFCIVAYILSFITFGALWLAFKKQRPRATAALTRPALRPSDFTPLVILLGVAAFGAVIANDSIKKSYGFQNMGPLVQEKVQQWAAAPAVQINTVEPLVKGAAEGQAAVTITEFADFRCIHCKHAVPTLTAFVSSHPDVQLKFQSWPLDGECNTAINQANGASCLLSRIVACANKNGLGWKAHDYIFEHQTRWTYTSEIEAALSEIAQAIGYAGGAEQLKTCAQSPETKSLVEKQAAVGTALNIQGTPTIYMNGKKLEGGQLLPVLQEAYARAKNK